MSLYRAPVPHVVPHVRGALHTAVGSRRWVADINDKITGFIGRWLIFDSFMTSFTRKEKNRKLNNKKQGDDWLPKCFLTKLPPKARSIY